MYWYTSSYRAFSRFQFDIIAKFNFHRPTFDWGFTDLVADYVSEFFKKTQFGLEALLLNVS